MALYCRIIVVVVVPFFHTGQSQTFHNKTMVTARKQSKEAEETKATKIVTYMTKPGWVKYTEINKGMEIRL